MKPQELGFFENFDHYSQMQELGVPLLRKIRDANKIPWDPTSGQLGLVVKRLIDQGLRKGAIVHRLVGKTDTMVKILREQGLDPEYPMANSEENVLRLWSEISAHAAIKMELLKDAAHTLEGNIICYHGSTSDREKKIRKNGLLPDQKDFGLSQLLRASKKGYAFLCREPEFAIDYARMHADQRRKRPILVTVEVNPALMMPDLDIDREDGYKVRVGSELLRAVAIEKL